MEKGMTRHIMNDIKWGPNELLLTVYLLCNDFSCSRPFVMLPYLSFPCQSKRSCPGGYLAQLLGRHPLTAPWGIIQMRDDDKTRRRRLLHHNFWLQKISHKHSKLAKPWINRGPRWSQKHTSLEVRAHAQFLYATFSCSLKIVATREWDLHFFPNT